MRTDFTLLNGLLNDPALSPMSGNLAVTGKRQSFSSKNTSPFSMAASLATIALGSLTAAFISIIPANAQTPKAVATFRDWSVFVKDSGTDRICFAATEAKSKQPTNVNHGDVFFLVASWKSGAATNQPSLMTGYNLKEAPEPKLRIGSDSWEMYTSENEAFIESDGDEKRLISAMRRGADMRVSAVSTRGTATSYTISLRGISAALDRARIACQ